MKKLTFAILCIFWTISASAMTATDIEGKYVVTVGFPISGSPQLLSYEAEITRYGLYYIYEKRTIGSTTWDYPIIVDTFWISDDNKITFSLDGVGEFTLVSPYQGVLTGFFNDGSASVTMVEKTGRSVFESPAEFCEYNILGETNIDKYGHFIISTNDSACNFNVETSIGNIAGITYTGNTDAVVIVDVSEETDGQVGTITAGNSSFSFTVNNTSSPVRIIDFSPSYPQ